MAALYLSHISDSIEEEAMATVTGLEEGIWGSCHGGLTTKENEQPSKAFSMQRMNIFQSTVNAPFGAPDLRAKAIMLQTLEICSRRRPWAAGCSLLNPSACGNNSETNQAAGLAPHASSTALKRLHQGGRG
jgi:hypothetical protein